MLDQKLYYTLLIALIVTLLGVTYLISKRKKNKASAIGVVIAVIIFITNKWIFPNVYIVKACGQVESKVMVVPATTNPLCHYSYGKHCYLVNQSTSSLIVSTVFYGNKNEVNASVETIEREVDANTCQQFPVVALDYIFKQPDESVRTKRDGEIKYQVMCGQ